MITNFDRDHVLILTGPTASGKTSLSLELAAQLDGEIINADIGQFYPPCSVGTAKPNLQAQSIPHHLFDCLDEPRLMNVCEYRERVIKQVHEIQGRGRVPILVGGSLFYIQSLFFPPSHKATADRPPKYTPDKSPLMPRGLANAWESLRAIDPDRAAEIHPNDTYRVERALKIWHETGQKPSDLKPKFDPPFEAKFIYLDPGRAELHRRIEKRAREMVGDDPNSGLVGEVRNLLGTKWGPFIRKRLIGYPETCRWIDSKSTNCDELVQAITISTRRYAKRQQTYWKRFERMSAGRF